MALKFAVAPSPLSTLLENAPVLSEALLNKPVGCVLLPPWRWRCVVIYHFTRIYFALHKREARFFGSYDLRRKRETCGAFIWLSNPTAGRI